MNNNYCIKKSEKIIHLFDNQEYQIIVMTFQEFANYMIIKHYNNYENYIAFAKKIGFITPYNEKEYEISKKYTEYNEIMYFKSDIWKKESVMNINKNIRKLYNLFYTDKNIKEILVILEYSFLIICTLLSNNIEEFEKKCKSENIVCVKDGFKFLKKKYVNINIME